MCGRTDSHRRIAVTISQTRNTMRVIRVIVVLPMWISIDLWEKSWVISRTCAKIATTDASDLGITAVEE